MTKKELIDLKLPEFRQDIRDQVKERWNALAKPLDGMGTFEGIFCTIGAVQETLTPHIRPRGLIIMCADNGIVARGVSQSGQEVTLAVAKNMGNRTSSVCRMANASQTEVLVVDIGINSDESVPGVLDRKVARGTRDFLTEPAMTEAEVLQAIETGMDLVRECKDRGIRILATGEMGIGNTTTSAAVIAALLRLSAEVAAGRGAGLNDEGLSRKRQVIDEALRKYSFGRDGEDRAAGRSRQECGEVPCRDFSFGDDGERAAGRSRQERTFEVLRCVGGLDIAGLCGVFLGGAMYHVPVIVDGLISAAAALCADGLVPGARRFFLASHLGAEPAMEACLKELELKPVIHGALKLGEGTGAVMMLALLDMTEAVYSGSSSFDDIGVEQYERYDQ